jgi:hypothetical protein
MKLGKKEDQGVDTLPLLGIRSKAPMEGATETEFGDLHDQWAPLSTDGRPGHLLIHMQLETRAVCVCVWGGTGKFILLFHL